MDEEEFKRMTAFAIGCIVLLLLLLFTAIDIVFRLLMPYRAEDKRRSIARALIGAYPAYIHQPTTERESLK